MSLLYEKVVQEDLNVGINQEIEVTNPAGGTLLGTQISVSSFGIGQLAYYENWNPGSIATLSYETEDIIVPGAEVGDFVMVSLSTMVTNVMMITAHVAMADTVRCVLFNPTTGAIDLGLGMLSVCVFKARS